MPEESENYRQFVKQFTLNEWKMLCRHRLFLHFLRKDLKAAASIAADALGRHVIYQFPMMPKPAGHPAKPNKRPVIQNTFDWRNHPRFRI